MTGPAAPTKLRAPHPRPTAVPRERLLAALDAGAAARVVLVSAPAGFGKSTLLSQWIARRPPSHAVAWVSLDDGDNDPTELWRNIATAMGLTLPDATAGSVLEALANAPLTLVLDDYHLLESATVQDHVADFIRRAPQQVQVVISTRADPRLPLGRLRAQGELVEVRAADLRFTEPESHAYLTGAMDLDLTAQDVAALASRTEGWIAALQLAALSLRGRRDPAEFIAAFAGDDRFVVDYLAEEVLQRLSPRLSQFVMDTCILDRLSAQVCAAVAGLDDAGPLLEELDRGNLFMVALDDRREWYRYHHLFADMLRARLRSADPQRMRILHERASAWWDAQADAHRAISHALASGDAERAADLIEAWAPQATRDRHEATLRHWIEALPPHVVSSRPYLALTHVGVLMQSGEFAGIGPLLDSAQAAVDAAAGSADPAQRPLPAMASTYRAALAQHVGDLESAAAHARRAADLTDPHDHLARGAAAGLAGLITWSLGDLAAAEGSWREALASLERAGHVSDVMGGSIALSDILMAQGRDADALRTLEDALRLGARQQIPPRGSADMHVGIATVHWRAGDLAAAREQVARADALGEAAALPQNAYRSRVVLAHVLWAQGDLDAAADLLAHAELVYDGDFFPYIRPIAAMRARLDLARGRVTAARAWAHTSGLGLSDAPTYLHEYAHVTLAMVSLTDADAATARAAASLLERLRDAAEQRGGSGSLPEILEVLANATAGSVDRPTPVAGPGALSARELDVLRLLRSDLTGPQIARELFISINTLRTHTKSIFAKLSVTNRRGAVSAAERLGLFSRP